jgi:hypothetical protein
MSNAPKVHLPPGFSLQCTDGEWYVVPCAPYVFEPPRSVGRIECDMPAGKPAVYRVNGVEVSREEAERARDEMFGKVPETTELLVDEAKMHHEANGIKSVSFYRREGNVVQYYRSTGVVTREGGMALLVEQTSKGEPCILPMSMEPVPFRLTAKAADELRLSYPMP